MSVRTPWLLAGRLADFGRNIIHAIFLYLLHITVIIPLNTITMLSLITNTCPQTLQVSYKPVELFLHKANETIRLHKISSCFKSRLKSASQPAKACVPTRLRSLSSCFKSRLKSAERPAESQGVQGGFAAGVRGQRPEVRAPAGGWLREQGTVSCGQTQKKPPAGGG